jgi:ankyrin repeat protein
VEALLKSGANPNEVSSGAASPLHVSCMGKVGQYSTKLLISAGGNVDARDSWGYTPLQRAATNDLDEAARALLESGASQTEPSGTELKGESARDLAKRLRSFKVLKVIQQFEISRNVALPEGEYQL